MDRPRPTTTCGTCKATIRPLWHPDGYIDGWVDEEGHCMAPHPDLPENPYAALNELADQDMRSYMALLTRLQMMGSLHTHRPSPEDYPMELRGPGFEEFHGIVTADPTALD